MNLSILKLNIEIKKIIIEELKELKYKNSINKKYY
jgi:hypothetical protein